jgi:hypothetical protein
VPVSPISDLCASAGRYAATIAAGRCRLYLASIVQLSHRRLPVRGASVLTKRSTILVLSTALSIAPAAAVHPAGAAPGDKVVLVPHRAVYDLTLAKSKGERGLDAVRGRILYDFSGNACEGYELQFRQVSELDSGEGKRALSDLRSTTWEDGEAKSFRFNSENLVDDHAAEEVDGRAERQSDAVKVDLTKPKDKAFTVPAAAVFPTEHMRRIIVAARGGASVLNFPVYDGSETGEKLYDTLTVIGKAITPGEKMPDDATKTVPALTNLMRWPVTISYFERESEKKRRSGEQTPVYTISFEIYENGISRALKLAYPDFTIAGEMTSLEMKKEKPCN